MKRVDFVERRRRLLDIVRSRDALGVETTISDLARLATFIPSKNIQSRFQLIHNALRGGRGYEWEQDGQVVRVLAPPEAHSRAEAATTKRCLEALMRAVERRLCVI